MTQAQAVDAAQNPSNPSNASAQQLSTSLTADDLWADVLAVRKQAPLVHSITNFVAMNFNANVLLAAGASPVMAHAPQEVVDMVGIAGALVLNIGTLESAWIDSMKLALAAAKWRPIPVVLDPVGAGATAYRNAALTDLLATGLPNIIRGNASEIMSTAGAASSTKGVDSTASVDQAQACAVQLARHIGGCVCVSGEVDLIVDHHGRVANIANGHVWLTKITAVGCSETALIGAFAAVQPDPWRATIAAMALMGMAGELAAQAASAQGAGVGSMAALLLDRLQLLTQDQFKQHLKLQIATT